MKVAERLVRAEKLEQLARWLKKNPAELDEHYPGLELHRFYRWYSGVREPIARQVRRLLPGLAIDALGVEEMVAKLQERQERRSRLHRDDEFTYELEELLNDSSLRLQVLGA